MKLTLLFLAIFLAGCASEKPASREAALPKPAARVRTVAVAQRTWPAVHEATGTVRARATATISSKLAGYVQQVTVDQGAVVEQGQTLVTLDARDLDANLHRAEAGVAEARGAVPEADSAIAGAKANLDLAGATFQRIQNLASKKSASNQELDEATARLAAARAAFDMARARRTQLDSRIEQAEQERRAASVMRSYSILTAPFAGIVTERSVQPGNLASPGVPLLTIERAGDYRLEAAVEESKLAGIRAGQGVSVSIDSIDCDRPGTVAEIVPAVDTASRSYTVKIALACAGLRTGMFGRARFARGEQRVLAIPAAAVSERGQLQSVFVAEENTARTRLVTIGQRSGDSVEVLSGLAEGEQIVYPVPPGLAEGARLESRQ